MGAGVDQPSLTLSYVWHAGANLFGGTVNWGYQVTKTIARLQAVAVLGPLGAKTIDALPSRMIGDPARSAFPIAYRAAAPHMSVRG
jgi:hypothetical protein